MAGVSLIFITILKRRKGQKIVPFHRIKRLAIQGSCSFAQGVPELLRAVSSCLNQGRSMLGGSSESSWKGDDVPLAALTQLGAALRRGMGPVLGGRWLGFYSYLTDRL